MPELQALAESAERVDDWYVSYVDSLSKARLRRGEIILHVCLHGTYHRGNAGAVLQLKSITPSRDSITDFLETAG
jgi:uncharacterized damage-inducible protein DinB